MYPCETESMSSCRKDTQTIEICENNWFEQIKRTLKRFGISKIERSQIDGKGLYIKILQFLHSKKNSLGLKFFRDRKDSRRIR